MKIKMEKDQKPLKSGEFENLPWETDGKVAGVKALTKSQKSKYHAPKDLSAAAKKWAKRVYADYAFEDYQIELVNEAARTKDRLAQAREAVKKDGAYFRDRLGSLRPHPGLIEERNNKVILARLIRELNLSEDPEEVRPPGLDY
jgi:hypothetical protein